MSASSGDINAAADTIRRPAEPWKAVERIAESDAGGWLMEFTAQALLAERQQAIDARDSREKIIVEQQETVTGLRAEVDRLEAKVGLLDDRNHWRWPNEHALRLEAEARCEQAIDALREADGVLALVTEYVDDLLDRARGVNAQRKTRPDTGAFALYVEQRLDELVARAVLSLGEL